MMAALAALAVMAAQAAQAALAVMAAMVALEASKMAAIRLQLQGMAAGGGGAGVMSAWLAGQAVLSARGEAMQVRWSVGLACLGVVSRMAVARRRTASVVGAS
jgi:hypothetical protein